MINITQNQLKEMLASFYEKGNGPNEIKTKEIVEEMTQYILTISKINSSDHQ